jgi:hypothetical protein
MDPPPLPLLLYALFFSVLLAHVFPNLAMFTRRYGRRHRLSGALYLLLLLLGLTHLALSALSQPPNPQRPPHLPSTPSYLTYDILLGIAGVTLTLTAASDFSSHARVKNPASGALEQTATVTVNEMLEHAFYQGLNLCQILYLHALPMFTTLPPRLALLAAVTAPWAVRSRFPVNKFSDNYRKQPPSLIATLYRLKKYQYLLYKHCLLHGLNISTALWSGMEDAILPARGYFRLYWLSLNAAYVLEFFLQTLVKKGHMEQWVMLTLNQLLMLITTLPVIKVLMLHVNPYVAGASLMLNLLNRGHDVMNVLISTCVGFACYCRGDHDAVWGGGAFWASLSHK